MRVLLLNPPFKKNYIRSARSTWPSISGSNWYPIFLGYAAGWLEKHGHEVLLVDALVEELTIGETVKKAKEFKPELVVVYISADSLRNDIATATKIKQHVGGEIVLVGPWCAYKPEKILKDYPQIDMVVRREFDGVLLDLASGMEKKKIKGLIFREGRKIADNGERDFLSAKELEEMPFVTKIYKEFLPISKYHQASLLHPFVDLFTGRGCVWGKCTFCLWPATIHKGAPPYRMRSIGNVVEELIYIKKELPKIKEVFFQDDTLPNGRARELSEAILRNGIKMNWSCYSRGDLTLETMVLMKKAGCRFLHVGYESGDEKVLNNMQKGTNLAGMVRFTKDSLKAGLKIHGDFILGLPGETLETIGKTLRFAKSLGIEGYQFFLPQPIAGTPLYDFLQKKKFLNKKGEINYPGLSNEELQYFRKSAMRSIYYSPKYLLKTLKSVESLDDLLRLVRTGWKVLPRILR